MKSIAYRTRCSTQSYVQAWIVLLVALGLSACGHARLVHFDGTPFVEQGSRMALENGWVAIDSCATGHHAVVVLEVEAVSNFPIEPRWIHTDVFGALRNYRVEGPWCRTEYDGFYGEAYDERAGMQKYGSAHGEERCVYRVRAEYTLEPPVVADSVYLAHVQEALPRSKK